MNLDSEEKLLEIIEKVLAKCCFYPTFENDLGDCDENDQVSEKSCETEKLKGIPVSKIPDLLQI